MVDLKEFHKVLLDILLEFDRVCRDNDIQYSLAYGTMLGAIRHKGFIPWDDDVDVVMDRKNYNRFCEVCPKSLRDGYFFQSKDTEPLYPYNISRLRKNNTAIIFGGLFFSCSVMAANGTLAPTVVPMVNGGQASIAISNTSPNLFTVPGDRIIAVNSLDGALTNNEQTASGGVVVATVNKKPFTFILETERGLNLSIQAVPREGAGRTIQLVSDLRGTGEEAGAWETSTPYESLLVTISQAVRGGKLPAGWYQVPVTKETLQAPAGLSSVADSVWTGNHLKMVRFAVENKTLSALNIRESDFWQPGTRAVMFSQPASQLLAGARMDVYVIRDGEGN